MVKYEKMTYADAGVDLDRKGMALKSFISKLTYTRHGKWAQVPLNGHYAGIFELGNFYGALTTDGVGTKLLIAKEMDRWDTVGIDCIAMNVNDLICIGAEPVSLVDYIAVGEINTEILEKIAAGLNAGAENAEVSIVGGETAIVPDIVSGIDLSATAFGVIENRRIIDGREIKEGDLILGLGSSGVHSNGYTLIRKCMKKYNISPDERIGGTKLGDILLAPTNIYVREVKRVFEHLHGIAHITGGGLRNLVRLGNRVSFVIDDPYPPLPIFEFLENNYNISKTEMYQTFNMGVGMVLVLDESHVKEVMDSCKKFKPKIIGHIEKGNGVKVPPFSISYTNY